MNTRDGAREENLLNAVRASGASRDELAEAWAERDQYLQSNVKLVAEVGKVRSEKQYALDVLHAAQDEIVRLRTALFVIARTTFSGSEMGDEYQRGNREAHETCRRMARAVLTDEQKPNT